MSFTKCIDLFPRLPDCQRCGGFWRHSRKPYDYLQIYINIIVVVIVVIVIVVVAIVVVFFLLLLLLILLVLLLLLVWLLLFLSYLSFFCAFEASL